MTLTDFEKFQLNVFEEILAIGATKGVAYASSDANRLQNFYDVAEETGVTPLQCIWVYMKKHVRAIDTNVRGLGATDTESLQERLKDIICYSTLMMALVHEKAAFFPAEFKYQTFTENTNQSHCPCNVCRAKENAGKE
jgi:hypothetical protein